MSIISSLADVAGKMLRPSSFSVLVPFIPGGVLIAGALLLFKDPAKTLAVYPKVFGEATPGVVILFSAYVAGVILIYVVNTVGEFAAFMLGSFLGTKLTGGPYSYDGSTNETWRKTATRFLSNELAPPMEHQMDAATYRLG